MANIEVGVRVSVPQDVDIMEVRCWHGGEYIADSVQRQGGSRMQGRTKWVLIYATLRLRLSLRRDWGSCPAPSASAFYAEARLLTIWSVRPNGLRLRQPFWPAWA